MIEFTLKKDSEFIELNRLLKAEQVAQTGGHAKIMVSEGEIIVNGEVETRLRRKLRSGDVVKHEDIEIKIL